MGRADERRSPEASTAARVTAALLALAAPAAPAHQLAHSRGFTVSTLNVHCPAYRRLPSGALEQTEPHAAAARHARILALPMWRTSDFVALQEFWYASPECVDSFISALSPRFHLHGVQRGYGRRGRRRPDGLLTAVSRAWNVVGEVEVDFADVGDRCAQLLHVRRRVDGREVLLLNTHLLFPHNTASHRIQVREVHKALAAVHAYKRGARGARGQPLPLVLCGDLNSPPRGEVASLLRAHGFVSSYHECAARRQGAARSLAAVTHRAHTGALVSCDYILAHNPSAKRPRARRWADVVFAELWAHLRELGCRDAADAFELLCTRDELRVAERLERAAKAGVGVRAPRAPGEGGGGGGDTVGLGGGRSFSSEAWLHTLADLGLGEACAHAAALSCAEMLALHAHLDTNLDGRIDLAEWRSCIGAAMRDEDCRTPPLGGERGLDVSEDCMPLVDAADALYAECEHSDYDIVPLRSVLTPRCLMRGSWPGDSGPGGGNDGAWLSDHGVLTTRFGFVASAAHLEREHGAARGAWEGGGWGGEGDAGLYDADYDDDRGDDGTGAGAAGAEALGEGGRGVLRPAFRRAATSRDEQPAAPPHASSTGGAAAVRDTAPAPPTVGGTHAAESLWPQPDRRRRRQGPDGGGS
ncbi:hypothetical protein KFE25_004204 [Diacronema lutheri]|uniref:EF-hand domain-containing protein n=1 Tax=Diacronema lutheri TaxID=2081491 RepID=A0A8J6C6A7_DIALT|nr:hypothetical protein KFE25_004204 [Diacronema lutheri]